MIHGAQPQSAGVDRQSFRQHVVESERLAAADDIDAANAETDALSTVAAPWEESGRLVEFLTPLLNETEDRAVRFAAASYLFHHGYQDEAVPALEAIRNGRGLESITARVILDKWRGRV